ncbi:MAG: hypothetical protein AAF354_10165 [Pseudomonadota bacterium]
MVVEGLERNRLRRLRILQALMDVYPDSVTDHIILERIKRDPDLEPTLELVRRSLQYLEDSDFVLVTIRRPLWAARAMPKGIDFLERDAPPEDTGVRHPNELMSER